MSTVIDEPQAIDSADGVLPHPHGSRGAESRSAVASTDNRPELPGIQYVRGIAALLVLVDHAEFMIAMDKYYGSYLANGLLTKGFVGVDLFFVLSGFIIVYVSAPRANFSAETLSAGSFLSRRFVRIMPFLWFCVAAHALLRLVSRGDFDLAGYLRAITLWPLGTPRPLQVWTLRHELLFYLVFAFSLNSRVGKGVLWLFFLSPLVWGFQSENYTTAYHLLHFLFSRYNLLFGIGYLLGMAYVKRWIKIPTMNIGFGSFLVIAALLLGYVQATGYDRQSLPGLLLTGLLSAGVLAISLAASATANGPLERLGRLLGDASYSVYLTHDLFISALMSVLIKRWPGANLWVVFLLTIGVALVGGVGIHLGIERPLIESIKRRLKRRSAAAQLAGS